MIKKLFFWLFLLFPFTGLLSQSISKVDFQKKGNNIIINYKVDGLKSYHKCYIELYVSVDGGLTFSGPLKNVTGDVGEITSIVIKSITWNVYNEYEKFEGNIVFDVRAKIEKIKSPSKTIISYQFSPTSPYGILTGKVNRWGYYFKVKLNGCFTKSDYTFKNGTITNYTGKGYYEFDSSVKHSVYGVSIGGMRRLTQNIFLFGGAGYGSKTLLWHINEFSYTTLNKYGSSWVKNNSNSYSGIEFELGALFQYKKFILTIGSSSINGQTFDITGGFGVIF